MIGRGGNGENLRKSQKSQGLAPRNPLNAAQINTGSAGLAGRLVIDGDYTQTATGSLNVELGGTTPETEFDVLEVSGLATLAGVLNVSALNGFVPSASDVFRVLSFGSRANDFDTLNGVNFGAVVLDPVFTVDGLNLTAV